MTPKRSATRLKREEWERLLFAFREKPGNIEAAARHAAVNPRTARRAWFEGWPNPEWARRPIREFLLEEQMAARAKVLELEKGAVEDAAKLRRERELARLDVVHERAREAEGVRAALSSALSLMANVGQFSKASLAVSARAADDILAAVAAGQLNYREGLAFITKLAWISGQATTTLRVAMESMRLHLGEPNEIIGVVQKGGPTTLVDGQAAVADIGEARLRQALVDLANGKISDDVQSLINWQVDRTSKVVRPGGAAVH